MRMRTLVCLGALIACPVVTSTASAQPANAPTPYVEPRPAVGSDTDVDPCVLPVDTSSMPRSETVVVTTTPRVAAFPPPSEAVIVEQRVVPHQRNLLRLRFGFDGTGGAWARGPQLAAGGLRARLGLQIGDYFAIYYQPTGLVGTFYNQRIGDSAAGAFFNSLLVELTLFDMLQIGAGPSADFMWGCSDDPQSRLSCNDHGVFFGLDGRIAVVVAPTLGESRMGLTISADVHPTWYASDTAGIAVLGGIGLEMF